MSEVVKNSLKAIIPSPVKSLVWDLIQSLREFRWRFIGNQQMACGAGPSAFFIGVMSPVERYRAESFLEKEPETLEWIRKCLQPGDVFLDIGANVGIYSLFAAKVQPKAQVLAFEPESQNYARLCLNIHRNGFENILPFPLAFSDQTKPSSFFVSDLTPGSSFHNVGQPSSFSTQGTKKIPFIQGTYCITLDQWFGRNSSPFPSLIKLDVDGLEENILAGGMGVLSDPRLRSILVEVSDAPGEPSKIPAILEKAGLRPSSVSDWVYENSGFKCRNTIFERRNSP